MKPGLRLQILLLSGALLGLAFVPLYYAISTYTEVAIARTNAEAARDFARSTARWVTSLPNPNLDRVQSAFPPGGATHHVLAVGLHDSRGELVKSFGSLDGIALLPRNATAASLTELPGTQERERVLLTQPGERWNASVALEFQRSDASALNRLVALYMTLIGAALLAGTYFSVTWWIIRPLDQVSRAAQRVASASHRLELPKMRSRELRELSDSLETMTRQLANEQAALLEKVTELEAARKELEAAQARLVRSERLASVGQLAAGLAHEVGNPLAAMQGMQDLILDGGLEPEQQLDFTRRMRKETERISRTIRDLLAFARPGRDLVSITEHGNVEAAINETVTLISPQPLLQHVDLAIDVFPDLPLVRLEQGHLTQVVLNLLLNAAAACRDGGHIRITAQTGPDGVRLIVEDDGPGVPEALGDRIFEPFVSTKDVGEGSGLGLSVCRGLIEAAGGRISLDTSYTAGARFVVELEAATQPSGAV